MGIFQQFPYSNFHDMNMDMLLKAVKDLATEWAEYNTTWEDWKNDVDAQIASFLAWFDNLDVSQEVSDVVHEMAADGTLAQVISPELPALVAAWLADNITQPTTPAIDTSLSVAGAAADAKAAGLNDSIPAAFTLDTSKTIEIDSTQVKIPQGMLLYTDRAYDTTPAEITIAKADIPHALSLLVWDFTAHSYAIFNITSILNNQVQKSSTYGVIALIRKSNMSYVSYGNTCCDINNINELLTKKVSNMSSKWRCFSGNLFITYCGSKIFFDVSYDCRMYNIFNNAYINISSQVINSSGPGSIRYYNLNDDGTFSMGDYTMNTIAFTIDGWFYPVIPNINCNQRSMQDMYIRSNSDIHINSNRLTYQRKPLFVYNTSVEGSTKLNANTYKYTAAGSIPYNITSKSTGTTSLFNILANNTNIANKKILMIGDSFVQRGWLQKRLQTLLPSLSFIGTHQTMYYGYMSEGASGSRISYFTDPATSPFIYNGVLNFRSYLQSNGLDTPDYVVINSAINETVYTAEYYQNMQALIDMVHADYPTIKVYVTYGANYATDAGSIYNYPNRRYFEVHKCANAVYCLTNCVIIPIDFVLDDDLDYVHTTITEYGNTIDLLADCVHPSETSGFAKMGNMIYNYLGI